MPRQRFRDEDLYALAGVTLANEAVEGYRRQGFGDEQIRQLLPEEMAGDREYFKNLGMSLLGEEIPERWRSLSREEANRIQEGQIPFEGWRETASRGAEERGTAGPLSQEALAYHYHTNPAIGFLGTLKKYAWDKPRAARRRRDERLRQDALARVRAGDPYSEAFAAEIERLSSLPVAEREALSSYGQNLLDQGELADLQEDPRHYWGVEMRRSSFPFVGANLPGGRPGRREDTPSTMREMYREHARRLGTAEARQEVIEAAEMTPAMFRQFDLDPNLSEAEAQERYRRRFGDTRIDLPTLGTGNQSVGGQSE
jgi:hypothetical protein